MILLFATSELKESKPVQDTVHAQLDQSHGVADIQVCGRAGSLSTSVRTSLQPYERGTPGNTSGCCLSLIASPHTLIIDHYPASRLDAYQIPGPALRRNGHGSNRPSETHYSVVGFFLSNANRLLACCTFTLPL